MTNENKICSKIQIQNAIAITIVRHNVCHRYGCQILLPREIKKPCFITLSIQELFLLKY